MKTQKLVHSSWASCNNLFLKQISLGSSCYKPLVVRRRVLHSHSSMVSEIHLCENKFRHFDDGFFLYSNPATTQTTENDKNEKLLSPQDVNKIVSAASLPPPPEEEKKETKKLTLWQKVKKEIQHYYHGLKLLFLEVQVALGIVNRLTMGNKLTRRERKQLVRTTADLARMVPFLVFMVVPFMEFFLPLYIKFFPFMMPSTFNVESKEKEKTFQIFKGKLEIAKFLQDTIIESNKAKTVVDNKIDMNSFGQFLKEVRESGLTANTEDIMRFLPLFEDEVTLESLNQKQAKALCILMGINTVGPAAILRFKIRMRIRQLKADDKLLEAEDVNTVPVWELQQLCRERGMRAVGVSEARLRYQLNQWLELHLKRNVPITLLLLTRVMYLPETLTAEEQLRQAIFTLPNAVSNEAKLKVAGPIADNKTKFEVIKEEQMEIVKERNEAKAAKVVEVKEVPAVDSVEIATSPETPDTATIVKPGKVETDKAPSIILPIMQTIDVAKQTSPQLSEEISAADLTQIESAIVSLEESDIDLQKQELKILKENRDAIKRQVETSIPVPAVAVPVTSEAEMPATDAAPSQKEIQVAKDASKDKAAKRLSKQVGRLIKHMDGIVEKLGVGPISYPKVNESEVESGLIESRKRDATLELLNKEEKQSLIDINDLVISLTKMQSMPDNERWHQILRVLDADHDGKIDKDEVSKVIKLLTEDNVKLTSADIAKMLVLIEKEAKLEEIQKGSSSAATLPVLSPQAISSPDPPPSKL